MYAYMRVWHNFKCVCVCVIVNSGRYILVLCIVQFYDSWVSYPTFCMSRLVIAHNIIHYFCCFLFASFFLSFLSLSLLAVFPVRVLHFSPSTLFVFASIVNKFSHKFTCKKHITNSCCALNLIMIVFIYNHFSTEY